MGALDFASIAAFAAGVALGVIGFAPLFIAVRLVHTRAIAPSVAKGLAVIVMSFAFLMAVVAAVWLLAPARTLGVLTGILVGFFAMWAYLAHRAMGRRF